MKLSVSAFRAQASAQRKILSSYQNQLNYGACTSFPSLGGYKLDSKSQVTVDTTGINPLGTSNSDERSQTLETDGIAKDLENIETKRNKEEKEDGTAVSEKREETPLASDKSPGRSRSKSNQRWMKLRTTVQLSGAISNTSQKSKPQLKREDSFLKRFSTRQIPEAQETVDTGDETETQNGSQTQNEINRRRRKRRKEMSKTVVNPDENFYFYWLMTVTVCVLYNLWTLIVRQSFPELQKAASAFWYSGDGFTDVVFVCDIAVQLRTGYLEQGLMVYDSKKLAYHYLKSRAFILDILSLVPLDFLQLNIGVNPILRFPRFLKIYRVYSYYYIVESRTVYPNLWRVVNLIHILLILAHWFGCFYYLLSEAEGFQGDWVYPYRPGDYATLTRKYLGSLYWSTLTLTTIGDLPTPETNAESWGRSKAMTAAGHSEGISRRGHKSRLLQFNSNYGYVFTIISYLIGVFIFATIVGQVGNVITNRNANRLEFERLLDGAKTYMRHHKVPGGMKRRVLRWYDYSWSRGRIQGGGDINTALGLLPDKLKTELALHVNLSVLKKVTIFQECQPEFLHDLVLKMKAYIFTPGDLICRKGEVAREMFIIADGILDVISDTGRVLTTMKAGDFFGEIGILNLDGLNKRTADVRSVGYSELFSLSREDVLTAMKDYPEAQEILQSLGRKRLMEAKNASKIYKVQAKLARDHDSSGDSDSTGKRIVEKLRSDVKGLKNALRRSRRETRSKEAVPKAVENSSRKISSNRHTILRRMSHVQSSDEYDTVNNEVEQSPIGAGLPLLQRLKLLKEKQEKEREEKEKNKLSTPNENQTKKEENTDGETVGIGLPFTQKLKLLKQKEGKDSTAPGPVLVSSTVRTQLTGVRFDKSIFRCKNIRSPKEAEEQAETKKEEEPALQGAKIISNSNVTPDRSTPERRSESKKCDYSVPKLLKNNFEKSKTKDAWKLLKYSSLTTSKPGRQIKKEINKVVMKVPDSIKGRYLSKSDTVLEKQKTWEREEENHSESIWPSNIFKQSESDSLGERNRVKSASHSSKVEEEEEEEEAASAVDLSEGNVGSSVRKNFSGESLSEKRQKMKKYNSISDLSPEYSGLPFVKKLKILNERQKLEELERELLVRSVSLDVPESGVTKYGGVLARSQSDANAADLKNVPNFRTELENKWQKEKSLVICGDRFSPKSEAYFKSRKETDSENNDGSLDSPESNETIERRHLKSILKKLSAEGSTSDEDQISRNSKFISSLKRGDNTELKKLMRAPTLEGYAARHKKLTKSVTFDSEPLFSPHDIVQEQTSKEGLPSMSPAAILTLQLSNLSMIPIAGPKRMEKGGEERVNIREDNQVVEENFELKTPVKKENCEVTQKLEGTSRDNDDEKFTMPYVLPRLIEKSFRMLTFNKNFDEDSFREIKVGILRVLDEFLEEIHHKFKTQSNSLQTEIEKRDEIIVQLCSRIQDFEQNTSYDTTRAVCPPLAEPSRHSSTGRANSDTVEDLVLESQKNDPMELSFDYLGNAFSHRERNPLEDKICLLQSADNATRQIGNFLEKTSVEELELTEMPTSFPSHNFKEKNREFHLMRKFSDEETESEETPKSQNSSCEIIKSEDEEKLIESHSKGSFINRMTKIQRTFSRSQGKKADFVALDIDDSSNSSDTENLHNKDWEVQMLIEELEKEDCEWEEEEEKYNSEKDLEHLEDVRNLQEEVDRLKEMVCDGDLTKLSNSELDILETIIEAKDQKISELEKSNSLDNTNESKIQKKKIYSCVLGSEPTRKKCDDWGKKSSLRQKIGQALSFDFHDIDGHKSHEGIKRRSLGLRKQKTISCPPREHQSVYNLWHTSGRLRGKVFEDSSHMFKGLSLRHSAEARAASSLPILIPGCLPKEKFNEVRTSLPLIAAKELRSNFSEILRSSERLSPSLGTQEETQQRSHFKQNQDSLFDESELLWKSVQKNSNSSFKNELVKSNDTQSSSSLNNFIKSVGQKVKQVMAGEGNTERSQVPTISKLCDELVTSKLEKFEASGNLKVGVGKEEEKEVKEAKTVDKDSNFSDSSKKKSKTEPPDL